MLATLLETFFPKGQIGTAGVLMGFLSMSGLFSGLMWVWEWFIGRFTVSVTINQRDDAWTWICDWLAQQKPVRQATDVTLDTEEKENSDGEFTFKYMPSAGAVVILRYKGRKVWMERIREKEQTVSWSAKGRDSIKRTNLEPLKELIIDAFRVSQALSKGMTKIHFPDSGNPSWASPKSRPSRPLSSVILEAKTKANIIDDAAEFLASRDWYAERGLPYRRGYLLYGPPGCGKSSFIFALAGHLGLNICVLNLSQPSLTDGALQALMDDLPSRSLLLLEDVDAAFGSRVPQQQQQKPKQEEKSDDEKYECQSVAFSESVEGAGVTGLSGPDSRSGISFSGLLNALDGVAASEGRVLFLTTNHIEKLDPALIRPGRVDVRSYFGLAGKEQLRGLFLQFYPREEALAAKFADAVPADTISMAALQGHFLVYKKSPRDAVENSASLFSEKAKARNNVDVVSESNDSSDKEDNTTPSLRLWRKRSL